ncbi:MAG: hypothetical protein Q8S22_02350 [Eubacteriales bacterium]|jgi:hypothetical protein|nr:hypothetical protein [Eubacteriales bacterium]
MLKKLMKHDFRALSRTLFPLQIGILGGGLVATLLTALTIRLGQNTANTGGSALLRQLIMGVSATASVLIGVAIMASALVTLLLICYHFYRSFLANEGYLTFTLPVSTSKLIWSKLLTGMFWTLINGVVIMVTLLVFSVFGTTTDSFANMEVLHAFRLFFTEILPEAAQYVNVPLMAVEIVVISIIALAAQMLQIYFAIVVGGQVAKKNRILAAIGMYLLINMGVGIISTSFMSLVAFGEGVSSMALETVQEVSRFMTSVFGWYGVLFAGLAVLFFFLIRSIFKKNLNLQ